MEDTSFPKVNIVILNWNNWKDTVACLRSIFQMEYPNFTTIVVDNGSTNNSVKEIKKRFKNIVLLEPGKNLGFAEGVNYGIKYAMENDFSDYIFLLNNDTIVEKNVMMELVNRISQDDQIGMVGGKIFYLDVKNKIWSAGGGIRNFAKTIYQFGQNRFDREKYDCEREVDFLSGCAVLIKTDVIKEVGLFDSDYFMYYEDVDFCLRTKQSSFKVVFWPKAIIWHKAGAASNKSFIDYYRMKNHFLFLRKRYSYSYISLVMIGTYILLERSLRIFLRKIIYRDAEKISDRMLSLINGFKEGLALNGKYTN